MLLLHRTVLHQVSLRPVATIFGGAEPSTLLGGCAEYHDSAERQRGASTRRSAITSSSFGGMRAQDRDEQL
jgi:hypothetical protein